MSQCSFELVMLKLLLNEKGTSLYGPWIRVKSNAYTLVSKGSFLCQVENAHSNFTDDITNEDLELAWEEGNRWNLNMVLARTIYGNVSRGGIGGSIMSENSFSCFSNKLLVHNSRSSHTIMSASETRCSKSIPLLRSRHDGGTIMEENNDKALVEVCKIQSFHLSSKNVGPRVKRKFNDGLKTRLEERPKSKKNNNEKQCTVLGHTTLVIKETNAN